MFSKNGSGGSKLEKTLLATSYQDLITGSSSNFAENEPLEIPGLYPIHIKYRAGCS